MTTLTDVAPPRSHRKLLTRMAERFGIDEVKLLETLKATAFKQRDGSAPSNEEVLALLLVAEQYGLNPFTREIYAFPDRANGIVPVVGVDGWSRIVNGHPDYQGMEFRYSEELIQPLGAKVQAHAWIECVMYRRGLERPIVVREYLDEVYREPFKPAGKNYAVDGPWQTHPKRFLRHKAMIQCARLAFGFTGLFDQDEAERISEIDVSPAGSRLAPEVTVPVVLSAVERQALEPILTQLKARALAANAWQSTREWIGNRFSGAQREYALQELRAAEQQSLSAALPEVQASCEAAPPAEVEPCAVGAAENAGSAATSVAMPSEFAGFFDECEEPAYVP